MRTSNYNLETIIYQYRIENTGRSFNELTDGNPIHLNEIRRSINKTNMNHNLTKETLLIKLGIIVAASVLFTLLSLVF